MRNRRESFKLPALKVTRAQSTEKIADIMEKSNGNLLSVVEMHEITLPTKNMTSGSPSELSFVGRESKRRFSISPNTSSNTTLVHTQSSNLLPPKIIEPTPTRPSRLDQVRRSLHITTNFNESSSLDLKKRRDSVLSNSLDFNKFLSLKSSNEKNDLTMSFAAGLFKPPLKIDLTASKDMPAPTPLLRVPNGTNTGKNTSLASALLKKYSFRSGEKTSLNSSPMSRSIYSLTIDVSKDHDQTTKALEEFVSDPEEAKLIDDYIIELLGIRYRKDATMQIKGGKEAQKKIKYMRKIVLALEHDLRKKIILKILRFRKNIKHDLQAHKVIPVIEDLTDILFMTIEINHVRLFLKTMHLIAEAYAMFGDFRNSIFVFNQLRLACELSNDLEMKIDSLVGLGDVSKKISQLDLALMFIRRALQYAWYTNNTEKELILYDRLGVINYQIGDMERANFYHERSLETEAGTDKNLVELSKIEIQEYQQDYHSHYHGITAAFFAKLSLPSKKLGAASPNSPGLNVFRIDDTWKSEKSPSAMIKKSKTEFSPDEEANKRATRFSTPHPLDVLLEKLLEEPEFDRVILSPRTQKQKQGGEEVQHFLQPKYHRNDDILIRRRLISVNQHTKQKVNEYSFKSLFGDRPPYKDYNIKIDKLLEREDEKIDFWTIKNRLVTEYKSHELNARYFFNHLSPNRAIQGFKNATDYNTTMFTNYSKEAIEILVNINFKTRQQESPLLKNLRTLLHKT